MFPLYLFRNILILAWQANPDACTEEILGLMEYAKSKNMLVAQDTLKDLLRRLSLGLPLDRIG